MSSKLFSHLTKSTSINKPFNRSSSTDDLSGDNINEPLVPTSAKSPKYVTVCSLCGRYKGIRMRRYMCITLSILFALLLFIIGAVVLLYGIVPVVVRSAIDKAKINFRSVDILDIQNNSFRLRGELELSNTGSIPATILAPLVMYIDNVGVITNNKSITINGDSNVIPIDSPFVVSDFDAFYNFTRKLIFQPDVVWHLKAEARIQPISSHMIIFSNVPFNKEIKLNALNGLSNVTLDSISLNRSDAHRIIADIVITITNPSIFSIELGRLYFTLLYKNFSIGYVESSSDNVTVHPGKNSIECFGELQSTSSESYEVLSTLIENYLTRQTSQIEALAGPNVTSYHLLAVSMMGLSLKADMPPYKEQLIVSLTFNSMFLNPSTSEKKVNLSASITIQINSPLGSQSPLNIDTMEMSVFLLYQNESVGMLNVSQATVKQLNPSTFQTEVKDKELYLTDTGETYEKFVRDFINANDTNLIHFRIVGVGSIVGSFALGPISVDGILIENDISLTGLNGLNDAHVDEISVQGEEKDALKILVNATIKNPGVTSVQLQNFSLHMAEGENYTILGEVPVDRLFIEPGINKVALKGLLAPLHESDLPILSRFLSAYLNGKTQSVALFHERTPAQNASAMDLTVSGLTIKANLDGIVTKLIREVNVMHFGIEFDRIDVNKIYITGQLSVVFELPSNVNMTFKALTTGINFTMRSDDTPYMSEMYLHDLPVEHNLTTNELKMNFSKQELIVLNKEAFEKFGAQLLLSKNITVRIEGLAKALAQVRIGNLSLEDVPINETISFVGYSQFENGLLSIENIDIVGALSSHSLALKVKTKVINPSVVYIIYAGSLTLDLCDVMECISLGLVSIDQFYLEPNENVTMLDAMGTLMITDENLSIVKRFISQMVSGIDGEIALRGTLPDNSTGTTIPLLQLAVAGLHVRTKVPGLSGEKTLVQEVMVKKLTPAEIIGIPLGLVKSLLVRIRLRNPFNTSLVVLNMNVRADAGAFINEHLQVGFVKDSTPITINANEEFITPYINVTLTAKLTTMIDLLGPLLAGDAHLSMTGTLDVGIGSEFVLQQIPVTVLNILADQEHSHN